MDEHAVVFSAFQSTTFDRDVSIKVNEPVGSASISPSGRDVVLASREGLHIIDLDEPYAPPLHLPHHSPWEVADVQWSPFASRDYWICSTSNQKALVWNLQLSASHGAPIEYTLHAHSRAITDINFSAHHPDILATCAVDSFVHCWDLRQPDKPANTFADFYAGATQVKWNRQDSHIIASSHDKFLRIWDDRKGASPLRSIEAHSTKIYGIDWNRTRANCLLTCSLDKTIKFWNYQAPADEAERVIRTPFPVWRARHTPFGWGVLAMPQRGDYDLHLYDRRLSDGVKRVDFVEPVRSYKGHEAEVKEFLWRSRGEIDAGVDNREFQLISWGQDRCLNFHKVSAEQYAAVGHEKGSQVRSRLNITRQGAIYKSFREENALSSTSEAKSRQPQGLGALIAAAGMSKAIPLSRGVPEGSFVTPAIGMHTRKRARPVMNPIKWMEGVTIGKQERPVFHPHLSSRSSIMITDIDHTTHHETPESLGDEITYVGKKYRKVTFETVDVARRMTTLSLSGPWGTEGKAAFLRLSLSFPDEYPANAIPDMVLEKNFSFVSDEVTEQLRVGINEIAKHSYIRGRGCLEGVVTYLLGERNLADSMSLFDPDKQELLDLDLDLGVVSSDEDDESLADFSGVRGQDSSTQPGAPTVDTNANVPLPKGCGAMWAEDGRLVCFFPPKAEPKPLFSLDSLWKEQPTSRDQGVFEGFGRLRSGLPESKKQTESSIQIEEDEEAEDSWESSSSSPSSSSSELSWLSRRLVPPLAWKAAPLRFQRSSQQSTGGVDSTSKATLSKPATIITLRDMSHLLPSKKELAKEYAIYGSGPSVCAHNAEAAKRHGFHELADVWNLAKMVLYDEVPLDILSQSYRKEPILVMARRAAVRIKRKDSGLNLNYDLPDAVKDPKLKGHVKWGIHPLAGAWLIPALFEYFEKIADIQMLAMLSCIFCEPAARESTANALMRLAQREVPISMKAPAFSLDYFPTAEVAWSLFLNTPELRVAGVRGSLSYPLDSNVQKLDTYGSAGSSNGPWASDNYYSEQSQPPTPRSAGITPPTLSRTNTFRSSGTGSFSTSPEQHLKEHHLGNRKSFTNLAARMIPFTNLSSSPDSQNRARRDLDQLSASVPKTVGWGAVDHYEVPSTQYAPRRSKSQRRASSAANSLYEATISAELNQDTDSEGEKSYPPTRASSVSSGHASVRVTLKNQNQFRNEAHASVPLLNKTLEVKCRAWRDAYAQLLLIWDLPIQMAEILKFNGLRSYWPEEQRPGTTTPVEPGNNQSPQRLAPVRQPSSNSPRASATFLGGGSPSKHGMLGEIYAGFRSGASRTPDGDKPGMHFGKNRPATPSRVDAARPPTCKICWETIDGLHVECTNCGWKAHKECLSAFEESGDEAAVCFCNLERSRVYLLQDIK